MKEGAIPQMTAVGPPEGSARDSEVAMAVQLEYINRDSDGRSQSAHTS
jgi:hypothetical protein